MKKKGVIKNNKRDKKPLTKSKKGVIGMAKKSIKHQVVPVPQDLNEVTQFIALIGGRQRAVNEIELDLNTKVEDLKAEAITETKPHQEKISQLVEGLFVYAEAHRNELTDGGKHKTVEVPTGTFGWRMTPLSVSLRDAKSILKSLKSLGLKRFIRIKEEINKEAMLKEPEIAKKVEGVTINQHEEFIVKPDKLEVEIISNVDKLKKAL